jgi:hypothetical protein
VLYLIDDAIGAASGDLGGFAGQGLQLLVQLYRLFDARLLRASQIGEARPS